MTDTVPAAAPPIASALPKGVSRGYRSAVLGLLLLAYTFNFIDRTIIATIGQAIKVDLKISDAQLGLLNGIFFALLYTLLGVPIARLAERFSRTWIITVSLVVWSAFTALCGAAQSFTQLALYRFGVGVGEAGCSPPSHALISDYYDSKSRASALGIYALGVPLGAMFGAMLGGWLAQAFSWRIAFVVVGLPGILLALVFKLVVKEPARGGADAPEHPALAEDVTAAPLAPAKAAGGLRYELSEMGAVTRALFGDAAVLHMILGVTVASFAGYGAGAFAPPFYVRAFGLGLATVGLVVGLVGGFSSGLGTLLGGFLTDALGRRGKAWYALVPAIGLLIATPIYIFAFTRGTWQGVAMTLLVPGIFHYTYLGPTFGVVQNAVDVRRRATATAIMFLFLNLIALGGGPVFTGWLIDHLAQWNFAHPGAHPLLAPLSSFGDTGGGRFNVECPGGLAPTGAGAAAKALCHGALAQATRLGIVITVCFYAWASVHYFIAAATFARRARRA